MIDKILIAALIAAFITGAAAAYRRFTKGSSCCGDIAPSERSDYARDKNKSHYPFGTELVIEGMICENCAKKVGIYKKADLLFCLFNFNVTN